MSEKIGESKFWNPLWKEYPVLPSVVLCRIPELEFASRLDMGGNVLDHCCGDGKFASLAWPGKKIFAGFDIDPERVRMAKGYSCYEHLDVCDASKRLPYDDGQFRLIFNNSALEHIPDLDGTLAEVSRVLAPGGTFAFNVLNHRYFEWWPLSRETAVAYRRFQPFYHALDLSEWEQRLNRAGMEIVTTEGYFDMAAARMLAKIDYEYSKVGLDHQTSAVYSINIKLPGLMQRYWRSRLSGLTWSTAPDEGAGYFITAKRKS